MSIRLSILKSDHLEDTGGAEQERSTFVFSVLFLLALVGIRLLYVTICYLVCVYRFLCVWHDIFRLNRSDVIKEEPTNNHRAIQHALVNATRSFCMSDEPCCPICLVEFDDSELVSHGRNCHHAFHKECISQWLTKHNSCPCCRQGILSYEEDSPQDVFRDVFEYLKLLWVYHGGM